jgi:ribonuclease J
MFDRPVVREGVYFLPLGGTGEIGMNLNLYLHQNKMVMVDCGSMFQDPDGVLKPRPNEFIVPDTAFVEEHRGALEAIVLTHAHEDHIGAILALWHRFPVRLYATTFTAEVLRRKIMRTAEPKFQDILSQIVIVETNVPYQIGPFVISWVPVTHSTLESNALLIETKSHTVLHTGDWKLDAKPVLGPPISTPAALGLRAHSINSVVCDSTNALKPGASVSEYEVFKGLRQTVAKASGRVFVTCFASNVSRLVSIAQVAKDTGRYLAVMGRAFENMISIAKALGYWPNNLKLYSATEVAYLPEREVLFLVTGSQGESRAALGRLSRGSHQGVDMDADDTVIFSAMRIPGNEIEISRLIANLTAKGVKVLENKTLNCAVHASGHPCQDELQALYQYVKPRIMIPTHGALAHLEKHAELASQWGIKRCLQGLNGDLFQLYPIGKHVPNFTKAERVLLGSP